MLTSISFVAVAQTEGQGVPEVIKHKINPHGASNVTAGSTSVITPSIAYSGGALIPTPTVYLIWYGTGIKQTIPIPRLDSRSCGIL